MIKSTPEALTAYRLTARRRRERDRRRLEQRRARAWRLARRAADLLKTDFGASRVVLFGSLVHEDGLFTLWSDVDVAAWGLRPEDTFRAMGAVLDLDPDVSVNLVDVAACRASLLTAIEREGIDL